MILMLALLLAFTPAAAQSPFRGPGGEPDIRQIQALMAKLYPGLEAACACTIVTIRIPRWQAWPDISGWKVTWSVDTSPAQRAAGQAFLQSFNPRDSANLMR